MKKRNAIFSLLAFVAIFSLIAASSISAAFSGQQGPAGSELKTKPLEKSQGSSNRPDFVDGEILVKFKNDNKPFQVVKVPKGQVVSQVKAYKNRSDVEYAEPNYLAEAHMVPNDPYYNDYQWNFKKINMEEAWEESTGENIVVAVIDTGIAYETVRKGRVVTFQQAPDLSGTCFVPGYDFVNNDSHPNDDNSHGTHVAGTIAQSTNNNLWVAGVAYKACLMPVKVLDSSGSGTYEYIVNGINWAVANGADVINMSLGGYASSLFLEEAVNNAVNAGVVVIASAGNGDENGIGYSELAYPARYESVIAVGATGFYNERASYSNYGPDIDIVAPGGNDNYSVWQNTFNPFTLNVKDFSLWGFQGTSMAAPHVAGVAALILEKYPNYSVEDVKSALYSNVVDLGTAGWDQEYGHGLLNAFNSLTNGANQEPVDNDNDGYFSDYDCDDNNLLVNPGMTEVCNGVDDNCDGVVDEGCAPTPVCGDKICEWPETVDTCRRDCKVR